MEKPWKVVAAFIGVFVAGAIFGGVFSLKSASRRMPPAPVQPLPPAETSKVVAGPQTPGAAAAPRVGNAITPQLMRQFTRTLKLTPEQREKLQPIVARAGEDFQRLREEEARRRQDNLSDVTRVNERMYVDVSNLLTQAQRSDLQVMRQRIEDRMQAEKQKRLEAAAEEAAKRPGKAGATPAAKTAAPVSK